MSDLNFLKHEIVFNPTGNEFDEARDQLLGTYKLVKIEDWEYKFIKQPKLSIPKKIAEELERYDFELTSAGLMYRNSDGKLTEFFSETNREVSQLTTQTIVGNYRLVYAYINPLTRPFVEVTNE